MVERNQLPVELKTTDLYKEEEQAYAEAASYRHTTNPCGWHVV
jgi:hypothetical protein